MTNPRVVFVDVYIDSVRPKDFRVELSSKNVPQLPTQGNPSNPGRPEIIFRNQGQPGFEIHFELKGDTHGYFFPSQVNDAVWSKCGTVCPDETAVHEVFEPIAVHETGYPPQRRILVVKNPNPKPRPGQGKFMYNLRVTNGSDWLDLDPPGDNSNGSYKISDLSSTSFMVAGAGATAVFYAAASFNFVDSIRSAGTALLAAVTLGFAIAALFERLRR